MTTLTKQHHFNEAAQLGIGSITGKRSDSAIYYFVELESTSAAYSSTQASLNRVHLIVFINDYALSCVSTHELKRFVPFIRLVVHCG